MNVGRQIPGSLLQSGSKWVVGQMDVAPLCMNLRKSLNLIDYRQHLAARIEKGRESVAKAVSAESVQIGLPPDICP